VLDASKSARYVCNHGSPRRTRCSVSDSRVPQVRVLLRGNDQAGVRRQSRALRRSRDSATRSPLELRLCDQFARLIPGRAQRLAAFVPVRGELGVRPWAVEVLPASVTGETEPMPRPNTQWCFPRCKGDALVFCGVSSASQWHRGRFQIPEPTTATIDPGEIEWLIMPALGCDRQGIRLGQGGGFYDRFLAAHPGLQPRTIALVEDAGLFAHLPSDSWDIPVAFVVSPKETWQIDRSTQH